MRTTARTARGRRRRGVPDDELQTVRRSATSGTSVTFQVGAELGGPDSLVDDDLAGYPALRIEVRRTD
jgi:hypothetical protein